MRRAVDHLVIPSRDLAAQAEAYRRFGFHVGPRNRHPWGTENHIIQFDGAFLELIGLGAGFQRPPDAPGVFSFAGFVANTLAEREGLAMLVLGSDDAEADRQRFARCGLGDFERFDFARKGRKPDGREVDVAFSLAFAAAAAFPRTGFFVCQQHFPQNFWDRQVQNHPNGALGISELAFVHERPFEAAAFLSDFLESPATIEADGLSFRAGAARIVVAARGRLAREFGVAPESLPSPGLAVAEIAVADIGAAAALMSANGVAFARRGDRLVIGADAAKGAVLALAARR